MINDTTEIFVPPIQEFIKCWYWNDNSIAHYVLSGERFKEEREILELMGSNHGMCILGKSSYATDGCTNDCLNCKHSIYAQVALRKTHFMEKAQRLCERSPKAGDCWEISIVLYLGKVPKYHNFYFECLKPTAESVTIMDTITTTLNMVKPSLANDAKYLFVKIARFDMERATNVSCVANTMIRDIFADAK